MKYSSFLLMVTCFLVAFVDLIFIYQQFPEWRWFTKPLLIPILILAFYNEIPKPLKSPAYLVVFALFFSWGGDIFLQASGFFIPGLLSFLVAHIFYILYFRKFVAGRWKAAVILPVSLYLALFIIYLFPYLGDLKIPVIIYSITIGTMLVLAFHVNNANGKKYATWFRYGALFFVLSDSILAVNLFVMKSHVLGIAVMITYVVAQAMIVRGAMIHLSNTK
ncbi:MAG: lysoplasmalogenase [Flavitalea sp.]